MSEAANKQIAIAFQNGSGVSLGVTSAMLVSGIWGPGTGEQPQIGGTILAGGTRRYVNLATSPFTALGGNISMTPATGGAIVISWSWLDGEEPSKFAYAQGTTSLTVNSAWTGLGSLSPTVQVWLASQNLRAAGAVR
ncbi:MAG: hypothetical protein AAF371_12075 [Pseudomonadota bacterium]